MPKVSVIIPTYNLANYICESIDSVLSQTYKDFEIIVVDDGSIDNTRDVLAKYNGIIRYFYQENKGISAAINRGVKEYKGDYIAYLGVDDIWLPDHLNLQVNILDTNPEVAMTFSDAESFDEKGVIRVSFRSSEPPCLLPDKNSLQYKIANTRLNDCSQFKGNFYKDFLIGNCAVSSSVLMRRKCFEEIGNFDVNLPMNQDYDLWIRIAKRYSLFYLNKVTVRYRVRDDSASGSREIRAYRYREHDAVMLKKHLNDSPDEYKALIRKRISECYRITAWWYLTLNDFKKVRRLCCKSLTYNKVQIKLYLYILISFLPVWLIYFIKKVKLILCQKSA